jgi:acetyl esterase/lipase
VPYPLTPRPLVALATLIAVALVSAAESEAQASLPFQAVADSAAATPAADRRITYGPAPQQFAELRLPAGPGPHPVVFLVHGGCWLNQYDVTHVAGIAEDLSRAGMAVWAVEYRRVGDAGAGVPGTFDDIRAAWEALRERAMELRLDLTRAALVGHSAGGHLALWLASEPGVAVRGVVSLAGVTDLAAFATPSGCGAAVPRLLGGTPAERPDAYRAAAPVARPAPPAGTSVTLVVGERDRTVPITQAEGYVARFPGTPVVTVPGAHFEMVAAWTPAWRTVRDQLRALLGVAKPGEGSAH